MKIIANLCRIFIGVLFIYSGFVKIVDPLGTAYKFADYFTALDMLWFTQHNLPLILSFIMCAAEFILGLTVLFNIKIKLSVWAAFGFMIIFTPITLWLAVSNKVDDCGCFGDAVKLSNWETFWKNIVIDVIVIVLLLTMKKIQVQYSKTLELLLLFFIVVATFVFEVYNYRHLPVVDFRPYKIGKNISEQMKVPMYRINNEAIDRLRKENVTHEIIKGIESLSGNEYPKDIYFEYDSDSIQSEFKADLETAIGKENVEKFIEKIKIASEVPKDIYNTIFVYKKDSIEKEYTMEDKPWEDSTLTFVDSQNELIKKGEDPPIHDFTLVTALGKELPEGDDITNAVLKDDNYTLLLVSYDLQQADSVAMIKASELYKQVSKNKNKFYCLTGTANEDIKKIESRLNISIDYCNTDPITLKTIVRSNPGLVLIKQGVVIDKWHYVDMPEFEELKKMYLSKKK